MNKHPLFAISQSKKSVSKIIRFSKKKKIVFQKNCGEEISEENGCGNRCELLLISLVKYQIKNQSYLGNLPFHKTVSFLVCCQILWSLAKVTTTLAKEDVSVRLKYNVCCIPFIFLLFFISVCLDIDIETCT